MKNMVVYIYISVHNFLLVFIPSYVFTMPAFILSRKLEICAKAFVPHNKNEKKFDKTKINEVSRLRTQFYRPIHLWTN